MNEAIYIRNTSETILIYAGKTVYMTRSSDITQKAKIYNMANKTYWDVHTIYEMKATAFASVNMPFSFITFLLNFFFVYCMIQQQGAEQMKGTLKVLLGSLIGCNTAIHSCSVFIVICEFVLYDVIDNWCIVYIMMGLILAIMIYTMMTIVSSCHCMNMFYFCQIVPLQHVFFNWFKRNINAVIYSALILNAIFISYGMSVEISYANTWLKIGLATNLTAAAEDALWNSILTSNEIKGVDFWTRLGFFLLSLCLMLASSSATVLYLWRHMKNMEESGLFSPNLQRQIKMTIAGITAQALLHFLCSAGIIVIQLVSRYTHVNLDWNGYMIFTMMSLYAFGTTINMGISQSLFRQRLAHVWQKISIPCP